MCLSAVSVRVQVAEGVIKHGGHYQAALSWAVYNPDPSIYNVQWAVDFFRECVAMGTANYIGRAGVYPESLLTSGEVHAATQSLCP